MTQFHFLRKRPRGTEVVVRLRFAVDLHDGRIFADC